MPRSHPPISQTSELYPRQGEISPLLPASAVSSWPLSTGGRRGPQGLRGIWSASRLGCSLGLSQRLVGCCSVPPIAPGRPRGESAELRGRERPCFGGKQVKAVALFSFDAALYIVIIREIPRISFLQPWG